MAPKEKNVVSLLNGPVSRRHGIKFQPELLQRMDSLYAYYHKQWWCYRKMLNHFKFCISSFSSFAPKENTKETTTTTATTWSSTRGFCESAGPSHGRVGESRGSGNGQTYKKHDSKSPTTLSWSSVRCNVFDVNGRFCGRCYKKPIDSNVKTFYNMPMPIKSML